jgi:enoyl-CoA hydratase/carnithine racemase
MIQITLKNRIGIITLNRPEKLNAINIEMFQSIAHHLDLWENDPDVDMVVIKSAVEKAFSAGGDLRIFYDIQQAFPGSEVCAKFDDFFRFEYALNSHIHHYKKPYIALLHGIVMGGGLGVSLHGSCRIVSEDLTMAMPECAIGLFPDAISSAFLRECPGFLGRFLGVTGYRMNAADALYTGLATHYMSKETFEVFLEALCQSPTEGCAEEVLHELLDYFAGGEVPVVSELERHRSLIDESFSEPTLEDALFKLQGLKDPWVWKVLDNLEEACPLSLKVSFELLKRARGKSFRDLHAMDFTLAQNFLRHGDVLEGIRAKIIDKDHSPHWQHKTLQEVPDELVDGFFKRS